MKYKKKYKNDEKFTNKLYTKFKSFENKHIFP